MKRLESMLQRLKVRLRRLDVALLSLFGPVKRFCVGLR
jgi:hypothetical protein